MSDMQAKLYAQERWSLLLIFQAMDAAGKDGTIKHVMSGINPQGCEVTSFKGAFQHRPEARLSLAFQHGHARAGARSASSTAVIMRRCSSFASTTTSSRPSAFRRR